MDWIIYTLANPRTNEVRYVGFTSQKPEQRLRKHINDAIRPGQRLTHKDKWILSLLSIGLCPTINVIESGSGDDWKAAERRWIAYHRSIGTRLVNGTDGGDGVLGYWTPEMRSEFAIKREAAISLDERRAEERRIRGRKWMTRYTAEERSQRAKDREARLTAEQKQMKEAKRQATLTPEQRSEIAKKREAAKPPEERGNAKWKTTVTREQWSAIARKRDKAMTVEQRKARGVAVKKYWNSMSEDERKAILARTRAAKSKSQSQDITPPLV